MQKLNSFERVRISFTVLNTILLILGVVAMIAFAVYIYYIGRDYMNEDMYVSSLFDLVCMDLASGAFIIVVAITGFFGAFKMSHSMLIVYFTLLIIVLALQISSGIYAYLKRDEICANIDDSVLDHLKRPNMNYEFGIIESMACLREIRSFSESLFAFIVIVTIVLGVVQLFVMAITMAMICWLRKYEKIDGTDEE